MNKKLYILMFALPSLLLTSCEQSKNVSMFIYNIDDTFMLDLGSKIKKELENYNYNVNSYYAENSQTLQNEQFINEINNNNPNLFLVNTCDRFASNILIEKAKTLETPLIFINREPLKDDLKDYSQSFYIGSDSSNQGELQIQIADDYFNANNFDKNNDGLLQVMIIKGEQGHQDTEQRSRSNINKLKELGYKLDIVATPTCNWSKKEAFNKFSSLYNEIPNGIELVLSNNDDMALGVVEYLKTTNTYDSIKTITEQFFPIIGVDATEVGKLAVNNEDLLGTVKNDADKQSKIVSTLSRYLLEKKSLENFPYNFSSNQKIYVVGSIYVKNEK